MANPTEARRHRQPAIRATRGWGLACLWALLCSGCGYSPPTPAPPAPLVRPGTPVTAVTPGPVGPSLPPMPADHASPQRPAGRADTPTGPPWLAPPGRAARNWDDYRLQAARHIVAANPGGSFDGVVPEPLLAIPVLEVELNADGSVRRIVVLRRPRQALDTVQLAIDAVHRAAPFAPVGNLPRPWKFAEVFLFDEQRRFKPRTLDF